MQVCILVGILSSLLMICLNSIIITVNPVVYSCDIGSAIIIT